MTRQLQHYAQPTELCGGVGKMEHTKDLGTLWLKDKRQRGGQDGQQHLLAKLGRGTKGRVRRELSSIEQILKLKDILS